MYERVTESYVADADIRAFFQGLQSLGVARLPNAC